MKTFNHTHRVTIRIANERDREIISVQRHDIYARELRQHAANADGKLSDALDALNIFIVALLDDEIVGFVSVTPPNSAGYSIDKYFQREEFPELLTEKLYEVRLLTVLNPHRGRELAFLLMYAAFRWVESRGGERFVAIGRREVVDLYLRVGLKPLGREIRSGAVTYDLLSASTKELRARVKDYSALLNRLERGVKWELEIPFHKPAACFHGGAFFDAIGADFDDLERRNKTINADVLDSWFPPSPKVMAALQEDLPWLLRTSPPTNCAGLIRAIAYSRGVATENILPGAGSSDLIFLALRHWLNAKSRVLILDPTYGEYSHVLEEVIRCRVDRFVLSRENDYQIDPEKLENYFSRHHDLIVLVNPNSPTGQHLPRVELERLLRKVPAATRVWIDETYVEYAGSDQSLERFSASSENVVVCKSMSKIYALSGLRAAYLCGPSQFVEELSAITPPWAVSLPGQVAAVAALQDSEYYAERFAQTHELRNELAEQLAGFENWKIIPGIANFLLCHLPGDGPSAGEIVKRCRVHGLFLRDAGAMGRILGTHALRIAIKDSETNQRMLEILSLVWSEATCQTAASLAPLKAECLAATV
ncbi:MAG: aminotransferase class I/II-fold pyridoxal phosphate-dependent enzyme [Verrucomicrobiota bacterium]